MVCLKGYVYLARGRGQSWLGFTHDPALDLTLLGPEGLEVLISLTPSLPIGIALFILQELRMSMPGDGPVRSSALTRKLAGLWNGFSRRIGWGLFPVPEADQGQETTEGATGDDAQRRRGRWWPWAAAEKTTPPSSMAGDRELSRLSSRTAHLLKRFGYAPLLTSGFPLHVFRPTGETGPGYRLEDIRHLAECLEGRLLFTAELEKAIAEREREGGVNRNFPIGQLEDLLQILALAGAVEIFPSILLNSPDDARCVRCGQSGRISVSRCVRCGREQCYYCEDCLPMGEARLCRPLYGLAGDEEWLDRWQSELLPWLTGAADGGGRTGGDKPRRPDAQREDVPLRGPRLAFPLNRMQETASLRLVEWLHAGAAVTDRPVGNGGDGRASTEQRFSANGALVWAACGAGKTEVSFAAISQVLGRGGRVLFAVPRKDVVLELAPRIQQAFPGERIVSLYGGSAEKFGHSRLVVATTHQAIRFYRTFDLVVLDEADAFPYQGSAMLYHAVSRARKRDGRIIFMTATPERQMKQAVQEKRLTLVTIPARHHGYPLPVPRIILEKEWRWQRERMMFPEELLRFLHRSVEGEFAQVFLFVPSVFLAQQVGESLKAATRMPPFNDFKGAWVEYSHSRDPDREAKRQRFSRQLFPLFVTTSIMERGITVPRANVVVLFAENERVYDERTLVQMAGRSGRSTERPYGEVWFMGTRVTAAMQEAVDTIHWLNEQARREGFLRPAEEAREAN
ncbi:DEAD/DEAH box helicase family protein [Heliobacterium gestii]|uniref:DEAD/DEAH box helicase family protein n=1 Tax=Heliomicrobium gestii TaxID=2699 RepID=A0A845LDQ4_HELGE|nr:DEAD/DEAH box helicase family protein [Heliomicrobium gestii]MBM7866660.1 competence protein ComFA [Heliomicrobium gestii]MZP43060.1 DEAD/DEAH box helicase family protein [Heliomicrobium gestii]